MLWNDSSDMVCQKGGARLLRKQQLPAAPCTPAQYDMASWELPCHLDVGFLWHGERPIISAA